MARISNSSTYTKISDERGRELLGLIEDTVSSIGKDLDRYYSKERDFQSFRFIITFLVFMIYAAISLIFLQITVDNGVQSVSKIFEYNYSLRMTIGTVMIFAGAPIATFQYLRSKDLSRSIQVLRKNIMTQIDFSEEVLVRVTSWERDFKSHEYYMPILKLKIIMLSQLIMEMKEISRSRRLGLFF